MDPTILGELEFGILRLPGGRKRAALERWFVETLGSMTCIPIGAESARQWARLLSNLRRKGVAMPIKDSLIAATALEHSLTLVTHNTRDFRHTGVKLLDPFGIH